MVPNRSLWWPCLACTFTLAIAGCAARAQAPVPAGFGVHISSPQAKTILYGSVQVRADVDAGSPMSYAVLYIDEAGQGVSNALPLGFDLDSTKLENGKHQLTVGIFTAQGAAAYSEPVSVLVMNPAIDTNFLPPASTQPAPVRAVAMSKTGARELTVLLDGKPIIFPLLPYLDNGRSMVMLRGLVAAAGGECDWDGSRPSAEVAQYKISFTFGSDKAVLNGKPVALDRPVIMRNGRTFIPVTAWRALFGGTVGWNEEYQSVQLSPLPGATVPSTGK